MLKRDITYEDFNGDTVTEAFYFNISKSELVDMEVEYPEGLSSMIKKIIDSKDHKSIIAEFKKIVLLAHGTKTVDGKRFVKSDEDRVAFSQTAAYDTLFMELATDDNAAVIFLKGVLPKDVVVDVDKPVGPSDTSKEG